MNGRYSHDHRPPLAAGRHARALAWALALRSDFLVVEIAAGFWTGSLALLADAGHMLTDACALVLALVAAWFAGKPPTPTKTNSYRRVEIVAAVVNALVLFALSAAILYEAYRRFVAPQDVLGGPMVVVAVVGLLVNLASRWLLRAGAHESVNVRGVYLEGAHDSFGSLAVLLAGLVLVTTGWRSADSLVAVGIGLLIVPRTWSLLQRAVHSPEVQIVQRQSW